MNGTVTTESGLIDCHAHLGDAVFDSDREEVISRARAAGVSGVVVVGETLAQAHSNLELARQHPGFLHPTAGLYPTVLDPEQADAVIQLLRDQRDSFVAIGEVGLDHWKIQDSDQRRIQRTLFDRFVDLSLELDLPLNIHSRSAGRLTIEALIERKARKVLMHAFDGRAVKARAGVEAGYFFSVPPSIVRSPQKQKLVRQLPLECLLLETDSPVLGPERDGRNEPANVTVSLAAIAEIKGLAPEVVAQATRKNTHRLLGL